MRSKYIIVVSILALGMLSWFAHNWYRVDNKSIEGQDKIPSVQVVNVKQRQFDEKIQTISELKSENSVSLYNTSVGQVAKIFAKDGSYVEKDQLLIKFLPEAEIKAPISGYLTNWKVKPGEFTAQGTFLAQIVDKKILSIEYYIPAHFVARLELSQKVHIQLRAYPDEIFIGTVSYISPIIEAKNNSILVKALINNSEQNLFPGAFVSVNHILAENIAMLVIPESSLIQTLEGYEVLKIIADKITVSKIKIGRRENGVVQILSGLELDDQIVLARPPGLFPGAKIIAVNWDGAW